MALLSDTEMDVGVCVADGLGVGSAVGVDVDSPSEAPGLVTVSAQPPVAAAARSNKAADRSRAFIVVLYISGSGLHALCVS